MRRGQSKWLAARGFFKPGASGVLGGETNGKCEPFLVAKVLEQFELKSKLRTNSCVCSNIRATFAIMTGEEIDLVVRRLIALGAPKAPLLEIS